MKRIAGLAAVAALALVGCGGSNPSPEAVRSTIEAHTGMVCNAPMTLNVLGGPTTHVNCHDADSGEDLTAIRADTAEMADRISEWDQTGTVRVGRWFITGAAETVEIVTEEM